MIAFSELTDELKSKIEFMETPREFSDEDYRAIITRAVRKLFVDTGRASTFTQNIFIEEGDELYIDYELGADEIEYILIVAQMEFLKAVRAAVNQMVSYSTDALTVTQGDKPYANITGTLKELENERRIVYYKMVQYTIAVTDSD